MTQIPHTGPGRLNITDISTASKAPKSDYDCVITVCQDEISATVPDDVSYSHYCMADGPHNPYGGDHSYELFHQAADELLGALRAGESILIHCHEGQSRSVSVATAALGVLFQLSHRDALQLIHDHRSVDHDPDQLLLDHAKQFITERT